MTIMMLMAVMMMMMINEKDNPHNVVPSYVGKVHDHRLPSNRPCHGFRRHLDESGQTCEKLQCLYENLISNNFCKAAVLKKISIVN